MRLSLAANYDPSLVPKLAGYPVEEVYGKLPADLAGGGRPSYMGTPLSERRLSEYVALLDKHGVAFNYLFNASCLGNREWSRPWQKRLTAMLARLEAMGIRRLTVSTPFLLELVKARFPQFKVRVGIYAQVDTPRRAKFWEDLGADCITLESFSINRRLHLLSQIRKAVRCDLQLIANHVCLPNCPLQPYHQNGFAHSSDGSRRLFVDYCLLRCSRTRIQDPSLFIKAQWIRPEDTPLYERLGFTSFKLLERGIPSAELLKRTQAYTERKFDGNLADLLLSHGFREAPAKGRLWWMKHFFKPLQARPGRLKPIRELARQQGMLFSQGRNPIAIDASKIPEDFLQGFETRNCAALECGKCGYCEKIAADAVRVDPAFRGESLRRYAEAESLLAGGGLWDV